MSAWSVDVEKHREPVELGGIEVDEDYAIVTIALPDIGQINVMVKRSSMNPGNLLVDIWTYGDVQLVTPGSAEDDDEVGLDIVVEGTRIPLNAGATS
jgi:hypothetical protein